MTLASRPLQQPFRFVPRLPGDKSITHRVYLLGGLAAGETRVTGGNTGEDCQATLRAMTALGARVRRDTGEVLLSGVAGRCAAPPAVIDLGNSGTGLRLLLGILAAQPFTSVLAGDASLSRRPVERVLEPLRLMGARAEAPGDHPPVTLHGGTLHGIRYRLRTASAQVRSAILLAGVQAEGDTTVEGGAGARDHTERILPRFGVPVGIASDSVSVSGPRVPQGTALSVPGDLSAGVFYLVAASLVPGSEVTLEGVGLNPSRLGAFRVLERMGLELEITDTSGSVGEPVGRVRARGGDLNGVDIEPEEVPGLIDELPVLAVAAAMARGRSRIVGAGELRHKESDRLEGVASGLVAIGARVTLHDDGWTLEGSGGAPFAGGTVDPRGDHRIGMAFLIAGLASRGGVRLSGPAGIETSDPHFLGNLDRLGGALQGSSEETRS